MFMLTWNIKCIHLQHLLYFVLTRLYLKWTHPPIIASEISNAPPIELPRISPLYKEALFWSENGFIIAKEITWISINMEININSNTCRWIVHWLLCSPFCLKIWKIWKGCGHRHIKIFKTPFYNKRNKFDV